MRLEMNSTPHTRIVDEEDEKKRQQKAINTELSKVDGTIKIRKQSTLEVYQRKDEERNYAQINREWPKQVTNEIQQFEVRHIVDLKELINLKLRSDEHYFAYADFFPPVQTQIFIQS